MFFPVFFLCLVQVPLPGQVHLPGAASTALGGSFVCLDSPMSAGQNQAGLGYAERSSLSLEHGRPFCLKDLGISAISGQFRTDKGAMGFTMYTSGLRGFRQSSIWLSMGMRLDPRISAGVGLLFWCTSIPEQVFHAPGIGVALGLRIQPDERWRLGARLLHPAVWTERASAYKAEYFRIESGISYSFFRVARLYSELQVRPGIPAVLCGGAEWTLNRKIRLRAGIKSQPFTFSWGISLRLKNCIAAFSFSMTADTGISPISTLSYEW